MDARYGVPPAPPPGAYGNIPTQRLPTQVNQFDTAPSCVQNAMMTKDKKPFTYTPGGIDLSQIKSPRMAKRIARNAQNEGVSGQPRPSPLAKPNGTENGNHSPSISMGAAAMGMPFQVFPTPPPPQLQHKTNGNIPPPPPPSNLSAPGRPSANNTRKSPTPQSFDPPPIGFRPEIKIPTNPMAALKKVPKPQEKNDFWVEEYKKERSKSPMVDRNDSPQQVYTAPSASPKETNWEPENSQSLANNYNSSVQNGSQVETKPSNGNHVNCFEDQKLSNGNYAEDKKEEEEKIVAETPEQKNRDEVDQFYNSSPQQSPQVFQNNISSPATPSPKVLQNQRPSPSQSPVVQSSPKPSSNGLPSPNQSPAMQSSPKPIMNNVVPSPAQSPSMQSATTPKPIYNSVTPPTSSPTVQPPRQMIFNNVSSDTMSPFNRGASPQRHLGSGDVKSSIQPSFQPQKNAQVGSIYIPPVPVENLAYKPSPTPSAVPTYFQQETQSEETSRPRQSTPLRWMASRPNTKETPEWAKEDNVTPSSINRPQSMYKPQPQTYTSNQPQTNINATISTTNTYQPTQSSTLAANTGLKLQIQSVGSQPKERIIPIQLEQTPTKTPESPNLTNYSPRSQPSPPSGSTFVTRNPNQFVDQGYSNYMNSQGNSNKARVIPIALDKSQGGGQFNSSARVPVSPAPVVIQNNSRGNNATATTGNTTPNQSKSFRILQKITSTEDGNEDLLNEMNQPAELQRPHFSRQMMANSPQQQTNNAAIEQLQRMQLNSERGRQGPPMKYPQPPTYVQQRAPYQNDNEQYIPPSQQQAPEPKIYTGSAIPSRSFKLLQAMTTPENAAETECSDVEQILSNDDSLQSLSSSSHFPSQSSFNSRPNSFCSGGTVTPNIIVTTSDDEDAQVIELLSHKLNELTNSSSSENNFDAESIDENNFYIKEVLDSDNYSDGSFDHIDAYNDYGHMMRSMKSLHNVNEEDDESDIEEIHLEVVHEDLSIITEEGSHFNKSIDSLLSDGTIVDEDFDDINEVTVRLPLKLSFSKSQNDENVATVEVGNSHYEDKRGRSLSISSEGCQEIIHTEKVEEQWTDVDDFWGTKNNEEFQVERKSNYKKAFDLFSQPNNNSTIPTTVEVLKTRDPEETTHLPEENDQKTESIQLLKEEPIVNDWQEVDDFWGTRNTGEEGRKNNYRNAMSFFTTTIKETTKIEPKELLSCNAEVEKSLEEKTTFSSKDLNEPEPTKKENVDNEYEEVNDFWGTQDNEDESCERRSNYKNARSFFASAIDENISLVQKSPDKEHNWWQCEVQNDSNLTIKEKLDEKSLEIEKEGALPAKNGSKWWKESSSPETTTITYNTASIPEECVISEVINTEHLDYKKSEVEKDPSLAKNLHTETSPLRWWEIRKNEEEKTNERLVKYEDFTKDESKPIKNKWYESKSESEQTSTVVKPEKKLRWWETQTSKVIENKELEESETKLNVNDLAKYPETKVQVPEKILALISTSPTSIDRNDIVIKPSYCSESSKFKEPVKNETFNEIVYDAALTSISSQEKSSEIRKNNETKGWWEIDETPTSKENNKEITEINENFEFTTKVNLNKNQQTESKVNETKEWCEADTKIDNSKEITENNVNSNKPPNYWWESADVPTTIEEKPCCQSEPEAPIWMNTEDLESNNTTFEEKPCWKSESEAPIWLNTEDLEYNNISSQNKLETAPHEQEQITRRSPSKAKEEISKRCSWWEIRESSVEPLTEANKRFSLIEDDRKPIPKLEDLIPKRFGAEVKMKSIKERIKMLETSSNSFDEPLDNKAIDKERGSLSRNSSQRSELESEVDEDSGVTDMLPGNSSQQISETDDTESENFPELRRMNRYARAATHSRLFKLLQDENEIEDNDKDEFRFTPSKKKIIHNVSVTRRQKPELLKNAESMAKRRERLSLPLRKNTSIDNDNPSTPNSPRSPSVSRASSTSRFIPKSKEETTSSAVNEQLVTELVQSLLLKKDGAKLKNMPMEKLQAAAKRVLEEQLDSLENTSIDSTPAITPSQDLNASDYSDYYDSWRTSVEDSDNGDYEIVPSKSFRRLQETSSSGKRLPLARCPRVLSSRTVNMDLARVTESPEIVRSSSERDTVSRCHSASRWVKIS